LSNLFFCCAQKITQVEALKSLNNLSQPSIFVFINGINKFSIVKKGCLLLTICANNSKSIRFVVFPLASIFDLIAVADFNPDSTSYIILKLSEISSFCAEGLITYSMPLVVFELSDVAQLCTFKIPETLSLSVLEFTHVRIVAVRVKVPTYSSSARGLILTFVDIIVFKMFYSKSFSYTVEKPAKKLRNICKLSTEIPYLLRPFPSSSLKNPTPFFSPFFQCPMYFYIPDLSSPIPSNRPFSNYPLYS